MSASETQRIGRIPLTSICTLNGARVDGLIVAVMVEDLDRLEDRLEAAERVVEAVIAQMHPDVWAVYAEDSAILHANPSASQRRIIKAVLAYDAARTPAAEVEIDEVWGR